MGTWQGRLRGERKERASRSLRLSERENSLRKVTVSTAFRNRRRLFLFHLSDSKKWHHVSEFDPTSGFTSRLGRTGTGTGTGTATGKDLSLLNLVKTVTFGFHVLAELWYTGVISWARK